MADSLVVLVSLVPPTAPPAALQVTLPTLGGSGHAAARGGAVAEGEAGPGQSPPHDLR